jgi:hypothetical protein
VYTGCSWGDSGFRWYDATRLLVVVGCEFDVDDGGSGGMKPPCTRVWWIVSGVEGSKEDRKLPFNAN